MLFPGSQSSTHPPRCSFTAEGLHSSYPWDGVPITTSWNGESLPFDRVNSLEQVLLSSNAFGGQFRWPCYRCFWNDFLTVPSPNKVISLWPLYSWTTCISRIRENGHTICVGLKSLRVTVHVPCNGFRRLWFPWAQPTSPCCTFPGSPPQLPSIQASWADRSREQLQWIVPDGPSLAPAFDALYPHGPSYFRNSAYAILRLPPLSHWISGGHQPLGTQEEATNWAICIHSSWDF